MPFVHIKSQLLLQALRLRLPALQVKTRRVLITGGTGAIGVPLVYSFGTAGYEITIQYCNNHTRAQQLCEELGLRSISMDFSVTTQLPNTEFDILINCAGINASVEEAHLVPIEAWSKTIQVNVTAPFRLAQQCLPSMVSQRWGRIINISSLYGLHAEEHYCAYNVSKHALRGLTRSLARDYGRAGVTSNEICPGSIDSPLMRRNRAVLAESHNQSLDEYIAELTSHIPTGKLTEASDVASLALYLASDASSNINGVSIPVDGGVLS